jgi:hypothetical protein
VARRPETPDGRLPERNGEIDPILLLRSLEQIAGEIEAVSRLAKIAS